MKQSKKVKFKLAVTLSNMYPYTEDISRHYNDNIKVVHQRTSLTKIT